MEIETAGFVPRLPLYLHPSPDSQKKLRNKSETTAEKTGVAISGKPKKEKCALSAD